MTLGEQGQQVASDGFEPGDVARDGIDLPVMGESPEGLGSAPRGGGIRAIAAVEEEEAGGEAGVLEVGIELGDAGEGEEAFVDHRAVREADDGEVVARHLPNRLVEGQTQEVAADEPAFYA